MFLMCCLSKAGKDGQEDTPYSSGGIEFKVKNLNRILIEFISEEQKIGLKETPCLELVQQVLVATTSKNEVHKNDLIKIYKQLSSPAN